MNPQFFRPLFELFGLPYPGAYMTMLGIAFILGSSFSIALTPLLGGKRRHTFWLVLVVIPSAMFGSKLFHILFEGYLGRYMQRLSEQGPLYLFTMFNPVSAGQVFYGGLVGGAIGGITVIWFLTGKNVKMLWKYGDIASFGVMAGLALSRIGCFLEGCCFGIPFAFGMRFPALSKTAFMLHHVLPGYDVSQQTLPLFPTQLVHSATNFSILLYLFFSLLFGKKGRPDGWYALKAIVLYAVGRFIIEFFRFDVRGSFLFFSTSQWISLLLFVWAFPRLRRLSRGSDE